MKKQFFTKFSLLIIVIAAIMVFFVPLFNSTNYGLDLKGGFEVLYQVSPLEGKKVTSEMIKSTYKTISKRIDVLGVAEPEIIVEGNNRIRVRLAGVTDQATARSILSKTASLTFRDSDDNLLMTSDVLKTTTPDTDPSTGKPVVALAIKNTDKFYEVTKKISESTDKLIVIWLDFAEGEDSFKNETECGVLNKSKCLSSATVSQGFASNVIIQGNFTKEEVTSLSELINSGSIPTKLTEISSKTVEASFGKDSLNKTLFAGVVGILLVMLIMSVIYGFVGLISAMALVIYTFLTFVIFYLIGGVLTLPGIAALVLGIGMAVDANVLNFESLREELSNGHSLKEAFTAAYKRSIVTIFDANITTLIAAIILFILGESSVKGFATMLIINIFVTIIIMVYLVKWILKKFVDTKYFDSKTSKFILMGRKTKHKTLNFLKYTKVCWIVSISVIVVGIISLILSGFNLGIDYKGGSDITVISESKINVTSIKNDVLKMGYKIVEVNSISDKSMYVKIEDTLNNVEVNNVSKTFKDKYNANTEIGVVSDIVKKELTTNAIYAILLSMIGIIIYVSFRFNFSYGVASVIALFHDVFIVISVFLIFRIQVNAIFIAAILTIIGYSINDTIVIFDRIKDSIRNSKNKIKNKEELYEVVNRSIYQTMRRTIYTSFTVLTVVLVLIFLGSYEIFDFNIALLAGLISGTYSTIFIATAIWYRLEIKNLGKEIKKKEYKDELDEVLIKGINS